MMPLLPGFEGEVGGATGTSLHAITHWNYASISRYVLIFFSEKIEGFYCRFLTKTAGIKLTPSHKQNQLKFTF